MKHPLVILRHASGLTQADLAKLARVSPRTISHTETYRMVPQYGTRKKILRVFELSFRQHHQRIFDK